MKSTEAEEKGGEGKRAALGRGIQGEKQESYVITHFEHFKLARK